MKIVIGREPKGDYVIEVPHQFNMVSRVHLEVSRNEQGQLIAKDLSTNGTFVNGERIKKTILHANDNVRLGDVENGYLLSMQQLYTIIQQEFLSEQSNFVEEFAQLKGVYYQYLKDRDSIIKKNKMSSIAPRVIITMIAMIAIWFLPIPPDKKIIFTMGAGLLGMSISSFLTKDSKNRQKMDDLTIQYNKKYVCPKCQKKLNIQSRSWNMLYDDGKCPYSKCDAIYNNDFMN